MKRAFGLVVVGLVFLVAPQAGATVILDTAIYNGHTYFLIDEGSWTQGEAFAVLQGGHLVTINDAAEQGFLWGTWGGSLNGQLGLHIGLTDQASEGTFVWSSGEPLIYTNWGGPPFNEPNNSGNEDYGNLDSRMNGGGGWNDYVNNSGYRGIVEVNSVVPEPSTLLLLGAGSLLLRRFRGQR